MVMLTFANMAHVSRALVQMSRVGGRDENRYGSAPRCSQVTSPASLVKTFACAEDTAAAPLNHHLMRRRARMFIF